MDGAVYEWDTFTGKRIGESVLKSCSYTSVAITPDGKTTFAVGSDKTLKEVADSQVLNKMSVNILAKVYCSKDIFNKTLTTLFFMFNRFCELLMRMK